ncbi:MAG: branched chain amino acid aminotransferase, partial [Ignavibacteria bacterium]|nr:branched chain amino acid aminotransferase [Ignavibacteria bacterium]
MSIMVSELTIKKSHLLKKQPKESELGFGQYFTDHLFFMEYKPETGWTNPTIQPYSEFLFDPAAMVLHYGQTIFEGHKAFYGVDGKIRLFRVKDHIKRFLNSARGMCIPEFDVDEVVSYIKTLVEIDQHWVPKSFETSLYIRPLIFATDSALGVRSSTKFLFYVI